MINDWDLEKMYELVSMTDIKTMFKHRNLPVNKEITQETFLKFLQSSVGVKKALSEITLKEKVSLFLMGRDKDVSYFSNIYESDHYGTFTNQYKDTYRLVIQNLVRKGILIAFEENYGKSKLERIHFDFPSEFKKFLPAPFDNIKESDKQPQIEDSLLRKKIGRIIKNPTQAKNSVYIKDGKLEFCGNLFDVERFNKWRKEELERFILKENKKSKNYRVNKKFWEDLDITKIFLNAVAKLKKSQFIFAKSIKVFLQVIFGENNAIDLWAILDQAAALGYLGKIKDGENYYQYKDSVSIAYESENIAIEEFLIFENNTFRLLMDKVPYAALEDLASFCLFSSEKKNILIDIDYRVLVKRYDGIKDKKIFQWFGKYSLELKKRIKEIENKKDKILLHNNLLFAKVNNFTIKALLTKNCRNGGNILFLEDDYIAFPKDEVNNIEKIVKKAGFAVKEINL